jgi:hypothetical protein
MRKTLAAAGVVALITAGAAACGTDRTTPQGKVTNAFEKLGKQNTVTLGLGFDGSADQIYAAMKNEDDFTQADAKMLASLNLSLGVTTKKSFSLLGKTQSAQDGAVSLALTSEEAGGKSLAEIRVVDQKLYLRADIKGLEKLDTSSTASSDTAELNQFLDQADQLPSSLDSVKSALKGEWISIDPKAFTEFAKSMAGGDATGSSGGDASSPLTGIPGVPKIDAATQKKLIAALKAALSTNVTYKDLGTRDGADHVQVSAPARQLAKAIGDNLTPVLKDVPGFDAKAFQDTSGVPNKTLSVDVAIKGGSISAITFDVAQLDTQAQGKLPLTLTLDGDAKPITAPAGAKVVNPQDIMGLVMSSMGKDDGSDAAFDNASFGDDSTLSGLNVDPSTIDTSSL